MLKNKNFKFGIQPSVNISRNQFNLSHSHKTTFNLGELVPFMVQEVYPGDTFTIDTNHVIRTISPLKKPIMDNMMLDMLYLYVPNRLVYEDWKKFLGENTSGHWASTVSEELAFPTVFGDVVKGSVADHMGLPQGINLIDGYISALPFRAFAMIYNEWFRDENIIDYMNIQLGGDNSNEELNSDEWDAYNYLGKLPKIAKYHDYFTSCLPSPQKGEPVNLSLGTFAPVYPVKGKNIRDVFGVAGRDQLEENLTSMYFADLSQMNTYPNLPVNFSGALGVQSGVVGVGSTSHTNSKQVVPYNLFADLSTATALTVNDLRFALSLQRILEKSARYGSRYTEYLSGFFGVTAPDASLQRPELLSGLSMPLSITQVAQTSKTDGQDPLGSVGAFLQSSGECKMNKSFVEHGFLIGVLAVRQIHTYSQGIERFWTRTSLYDFYNPVLAHIGEQPVYTYELYNDPEGYILDDQTIFGYNEAWADLRYKPNKVTGGLVDDGLGSWTLHDDYEDEPVLSKEFIDETCTYLDRCLNVPSTIVDNFIIDIYNDVRAIRPLPLYSIPGLGSHS